MRPYWDSRGSSPIGYRLAHGAFWSVMGTGISQSINLITLIVVVRLLGKVHFGEFGIIGNTAAMFSVFATLGLALTSTKHVAEFRKTDPAKAGRIVALLSLVATGTALLMAAILIFAAPWLARSTLSAPHLANLLRISAAIIFFSSINGVQMGALAGFEAFRTIAQINSLNTAFSLPLFAGGAYFFGLPGAVLGMVISLCVICIISSIELRKVACLAGVPIGFTGCGKEVNILLLIFEVIIAKNGGFVKC